jgi:HK97 family phage major capsid protein
LISENTAVAAADPSFAVVNFGAYKISSKLVLVPNELMEDNAVNLAEQIGMMIGERIGRAQSVYFTTGTGSSQPQGILAGATLGVTAASTTVIAPNEIIDLIHTVDPAYRTDPSFGLMMSDGVLAFVRKMTDGNGRYLYPENSGNTILGYPVFVNQQMSSTFTTGQKLMLAGAFKKYKIRDVNSIRFRRLEERYAEYDQTGFIAFMRSDAHLLDAATHPIKYLKLA